MQELTREEVIERGIVSKALLDNPAFISVFSELLNNFSEQTFATSPDQGALRSALYHQHVALQTIIGTLRSRTAAMEQVLEDVEEESQE